jgi:UDP-N-acetylmuramoyl-tripeptide--D-alanyl-D-alanine ligase
MKKIAKLVLKDLLWEHALEMVKQQKPDVVAITGSVGKTSTKDAVAAVLSAGNRPVIKTKGNLATEIGVPLSLLGYEENPSGTLEWIKVAGKSIGGIAKVTTKPYYVLEYSADKPGDIAFLAGKIPPTVAVITSIVPVHMQNYQEIGQLVAEKLSLLENLPKHGFAVLNADDPHQSSAQLKCNNIIWYGITSDPGQREGVWARDVEPTDKGIRCTLELRILNRTDGISRLKTYHFSLQTQLIGTHQLYSLLAAAAVGFHEGIDPDKVKAALEGYSIPNGRGKLIPGQKDITIIDDTYNASPEAVKSGLRMLRPFAKERRVVAVLGNMNELGDIAEAAHKEVARVAAASVDSLVVVGPFAETMRNEAIAGGLAQTKVIAFQNTEQLLDKVEQLVQSKDVVYVKGSQNNVRLERFVKAIMAHPEEAEQLLVRQGKQWR